MTALADTNVTLTKVKKHRIGLMRECIYQVSFGNAALTVPANGVPLPALAQFGGLRTVKFHQIAPVTINGYDYKYDEVNHSIRIYQSAEFTPAGTNAAEATHVHVENTAASYTQNANTAAGASHNHVLTGTLNAAGPLTHVPTSHAPAATVLRLLLRG